MFRTFALLLLSIQIESYSEVSLRTEGSTDSYAEAREKMVLEQIADRGIMDPRVLEAMKKVPRHELVPLRVRHLSYKDYPLPIEKGQTISQPYIVAFMTEHLKLQGHERVLEIGTGSGYQAAILAELCQKVFSIEIVKSLAERARDDLKRIGYKNINIRVGDGYQGWPEEAPFDAIIVTAAPDHIPQPLIEQLKIGGRLILPIGKDYQELLLVTRKNNGIRKRKLLPVRFVPMTGKAQEK